MRPRLYTEIPRDGDNWRFVRSGPSGLEPVPESAGIPSGADVVVFVPGTEVTAHRVRAAARRPVELTRLATFAIEDDLAVPVESVHVAVSADQDDAGFRIVYAVSHTVMQHWLAQLEAAGLGSARIVPDLSLLPPTEQVDFGRYQLLTVEGRPVAFDNDWPSDVMSALLKGTEANAAPRRAESLTELALWAEVAPRLTDLRQGTYARASETGISLKQFRLPAALAATLFVAWGRADGAVGAYDEESDDGAGCGIPRAICRRFPGPAGAVQSCRRLALAHRVSDQRRRAQLSADQCGAIRSGGECQRSEFGQLAL